MSLFCAQSFITMGFIPFYSFPSSSLYMWLRHTSLIFRYNFFSKILDVFFICVAFRFDSNHNPCLNSLVLCSVSSPGISHSRPPTLWASVTLCGWRSSPISAERGGHSQTVSPLHSDRPGQPWRRSDSQTTEPQELIVLIWFDI